MRAAIPPDFVRNPADRARCATPRSWSERGTPVRVHADDVRVDDVRVDDVRVDDVRADDVRAGRVPFRVPVSRVPEFRCPPEEIAR
ncbi:hypothetical protein [Rhodoplanes azumiensis]|uniref:Uncharacterized protein n=1 Tax=Rhodoplanes azumiensis TaxID=1897628 RepID=A0ABW5AI57_9BRAD